MQYTSLYVHKISWGEIWSKADILYLYNQFIVLWNFWGLGDGSGGNLHLQNRMSIITGSRYTSSGHVAFWRTCQAFNSQVDANNSGLSPHFPKWVGVVMLCADEEVSKFRGNFAEVAAQRRLFSDGMSPKSFMLTLLVPTIIPSCKLLGTELGLADDVFWFRENTCNDGNYNRTTSAFI